MARLFSRAKDDGRAESALNAVATLEKKRVGHPANPRLVDRVVARKSMLLKEKSKINGAPWFARASGWVEAQSNFYLAQWSK